MFTTTTPGFANHPTYGTTIANVHPIPALGNVKVQKVGTDQVQILPYFREEPTFNVVDDPKKNLLFFECNIGLTVSGKIKGVYSKEFNGKNVSSMRLEVVDFLVSERGGVDNQADFVIAPATMIEYLRPALAKVGREIGVGVANKIGEPSIFIKHNDKLCNKYFEPVTVESFMRVDIDHQIKVDCELKIYFDKAKNTAATCIVAKKIYE